MLRHPRADVIFIGEAESHCPRFFAEFETEHCEESYCCVEPPALDQAVNYGSRICSSIFLRPDDSLLLRPVDVLGGTDLAGHHEVLRVRRRIEALSSRSLVVQHGRAIT